MTTLIPKFDLKNGTTTPTGAINRPINKKLAETVSVLDFGADSTGATDSSAAFQAAVNAAKFVLVPQGTYLINTTVNIPTQVNLIGQGMYNVSNIIVNNDITCFNITNNVTLKNLFITHTGDGIIVNAPQALSIILEFITFYASSTSSTKDLIYTSGSFTWIRQCGFNSARPYGNCINLDRTGDVINIESHIELNGFGGAGSAIVIQSSDNSGRPEGVHITNNSFIGQHENLRINQVLECTISNNVFDQGGAYNVIFNPTGSGINSVQLTGNYFSTPSAPSDGVAVVHLNPTSGIPLAQIGFTDNTFTFCGIGCALYAPATSITFVGNSFAAIGNAGIGLNGVQKAVILGNTFDSVTTTNISLIDGASGGPFSVDANQFWSSANCTFTKTTPGKFLFGITNTGNQLAGWSSVATTSSATPSGGYIYVPHGLRGTPDKGKIIASLVPNSLTVSGAVNVTVVFVDETNIELQVFYTSTGGSTYDVNVFASL